MRVIPPLTITSAMLTSSTVPEPDTGEVAWNAATAYTVGQVAYRAANHMRYERLVAGTTATAPESDPVNWLELGPTNRWAMFDLLRNTGTVKASPITVVLTPGRRVDSIAMVGMQADSVSVSMTSGGVPVYSRTFDLTVREVVDWFGYFFEPFTFRPNAAFFDLPPYSNAVITVTATRATGTVTFGGLLIGTSVYIGVTLIGAESDALNFSIVERDPFGNATLIPRRTVPKSNQTVIADKTNVNRIRQVRDALNAVPAYWSWLDDQEDDYFDAGVILGIYKRFTITLDQPAPESATISLELEEV